MWRARIGWCVRLLCLVPILGFLGTATWLICASLYSRGRVVAPAILLVVAVWIGIGITRWSADRMTSLFDVFGVAAVMIVVTALIWPAIEAGHHRATRMVCPTNLKQIALGLHHYRDVYRKLTRPYVADSAGKPIHSWRVMLLPFVEQQALHEQYDMHSAWNSRANSMLVSLRPPLYHCSRAKNESHGDTQYFAIVGAETMWPGDRSVDFMDISDGASNTLAIVESHGLGVTWTEPRDLDFDQVPWRINTDPASSGISSPHPGGASVALLDGSVRFLSETTDEQILKAMATANGGEEIDDNY